MHMYWTSSIREGQIALYTFNGVSFIGENVESQEHILLNGP